MKRLSDINESLWGNSVKRSRGDEVRKEDTSTFFSNNTECIFYTEGEKRLFDWKEVEEILKKMKGWRIPNIQDVKSTVRQETFTELFGNKGYYGVYDYSDDKDSFCMKSNFGELNVDKIGCINSIGEIQSDFTGFWLDYSCKGYGHDGNNMELKGVVYQEENLSPRLWTADKEWHFQLLLIKSGVSESLWKDSMKRCRGEEVRKEDKQNYFFGKGIEYKILKTEEGDEKLFNWKEALEELKKYPGWRIPTITDIAYAAGKNRDVPGNISMKQSNEGWGKWIIYSDYGEIELHAYGTRYMWIDGEEMTLPSGRKAFELKYGMDMSYSYGDKAFVCSGEKSDRCILILIKEL